MYRFFKTLSFLCEEERSMNEKMVTISVGRERRRSHTSQQLQLQLSRELPIGMENVLSYGLILLNK